LSNALRGSFSPAIDLYQCDARHFGVSTTIQDIFSPSQEAVVSQANTGTGVSRRNFVKGAGVAAAAGLGGAALSGAARGAETEGKPHYGMLIDVRRCIGCQAVKPDELVLTTYKVAVQIHSRSQNCKWLTEIYHSNPG
jgi:hypothetical protein